MVAAEIEAPPNLRDPNDLHVLAAALAGNADAIVTGDQDLLALGSYEGIPILTPAAFLDRFPAG